MNKLRSLFKLLKFFWDHSDGVLKLLEGLRGKLPQLVAALRSASTGLNTASGALSSAVGEIVHALENAGGTITSVKVPKLELSTSGFMDVLVEALNAIFEPDPPAPPSDVRDRLNNIRLLNAPRLSGQGNPFSTFGGFLNQEGLVIANYTGPAQTALQDTATGLSDFADLLEALE